METYRHALYRYSTGQGFNPNVDVPEKVEQVTSYKFQPLLTRMNMNPELTVDIRREADRIAMQVEAAQRAMKNIGYDEQIGKDFKKLKIQLEVMQHMTTNYPIRYVKVKDLDKLFQFYEKNTPGLDKLIAKVVEENRNSTGITPYVGTAYRVRKGYPLFDRYGKRLTLEKKETFLKDEIAKEKSKETGVEKALSGLGDLATSSKIIAPLVIIGILFLILKK